MWTFSSLDLAVKTKMFTQGLTATTSDSTRGSSASTHILAVQIASIQKTGGDLGLYQCSESVAIFYCQSGWQEKHSGVVRGSCLHEIWDEENLLNWRRRTAGDKLMRDCHAPTCSLVGWCLLRGYFNRIAKRLDIDSKRVKMDSDVTAACPRMCSATQWRAWIVHMFLTDGNIP